MENYFRDALNNFIFEEAGGGAIRHLANRGYTARQIADTLSFPIPYEKVREAFTKHLLENGILLRERPEAGIKQEKTEYVREYDRYGKPSYRKVIISTKVAQADRGGRERSWEEMDFEAFLLLYRSGTENLRLAAETELAEVEKNIYISCAFGAGQAGEMLYALDAAEAEYIRGICWTKKTMYHLLDKRMFGIFTKLWKAGTVGTGTAVTETPEAEIAEAKITEIDTAEIRTTETGASAKKESAKITGDRAAGKVYIMH